jgi:hypothetical protein
MKLNYQQAAALVVEAAIKSKGVVLEMLGETYVVSLRHDSGTNILFAGKKGAEKFEVSYSVPRKRHSDFQPVLERRLKEYFAEGIIHRGEIGEEEVLEMIWKSRGDCLYSKNEGDCPCEVCSIYQERDCYLCQIERCTCADWQLRALGAPKRNSGH